MAHGRRTVIARVDIDALATFFADTITAQISELVGDLAKGGGVATSVDRTVTHLARNLATIVSGHEVPRELLVELLVDAAAVDQLDRVHWTMPDGERACGADIGRSTTARREVTCGECRVALRIRDLGRDLGLTATAAPIADPAEITGERVLASAVARGIAALPPAISPAKILLASLGLDLANPAVRARLLELHRASEIVLARVDMVPSVQASLAARGLDPELLRASAITDRGVLYDVVLVDLPERPEIEPTELPAARVVGGGR